MPCDAWGLWERHRGHRHGVTRTPYRDTYLALVLSRRPSKVVLWTTVFLAAYLLDIPLTRWMRSKYAQMKTAADVAANVPPPVPLPHPAEARVRALQEQLRRMEAARSSPPRIAQRSPAAPTPAPVSLPEGTTLTISLTDAIATDRNVSGDAFAAVLADDVVARGRVVARAGAKVSGRIVEVQRGKDKEPPVLTLALVSVGPIRVATQPLVLRGKKQSKFGRLFRGAGGATLGAILGKKAGGTEGALAGGALGAVVAMRGDAVELEKGTMLGFEVGR